jgi:hypothetical protein
MHPSESWSRRVGTTRPAEDPRACLGLRRGLGARRTRLRIKEDALGRGHELILGDDYAAVARELQVDFGQWTIVPTAEVEGGAMQRIWLAVVVGECSRWVRVQQVARVRFFRRRVQSRGR